MDKAEILRRIGESAPKAERVETKDGQVWYMVRQNGARRWALLELQGALAKTGQSRIPPAAVVSVALCDAEGAPIFKDLDEAFESVSLMEFTLLEELYSHALRITGLAPRAVEDAEKKS